MTRISAVLATAGLLLFLQPAQASSLESATLVLNRLAFGPRPGEAEKLASSGQAGIQRWIEQQLHPDSIPDPIVERKLGSFPSLNMSMAEAEKSYVPLRDIAKNMGMAVDGLKDDDEVMKNLRKKVGEEHLPYRMEEELVASKLMRAVESRRQLQEVLVDFWFNHFNIDITKGEDRYFIESYERDVIRKHLFGKFIDLLRASATHPAMLYYLDNHLSVASLENRPDHGAKSKKNTNGLNENYGRELLELHTLGVDGGYTQADVTSAARVLTGWSIDAIKTDPQFKFRENVHDVTAKTVMEHPFEAGRGMDEGIELLEFLSKHPKTAHRIATKLCRYFVSDHPSEKLIQKVASRYLKTDGNLTEVYREIFRSPEFWAQAQSKNFVRSKIKAPFYFVASSVRALGGELELKNPLQKALTEMGEQLYHCQPPTGFADRPDAWVNPGALVTRLNFGLRLAANRADGVYVQLPSFETPPKSVSKLVSQIETRILHRRLSKASEQIVLNEFKDDQQMMADGEVRPLSVAKAVGLILGSPEFQRR